MESPDWIAYAAFHPAYARVVGWAIDEPYGFALIDSNGDGLEVSFELFERQAEGWHDIYCMDDVRGDGPTSGRWYSDVVWAYGRGAPGSAIAVGHRGVRHEVVVAKNGWWAFIRRADPTGTDDVPRPA